MTPRTATTPAPGEDRRVRIHSGESINPLLSIDVSQREVDGPPRCDCASSGGVVMKHPATFSRVVIAAIDAALPVEGRVLDPFAGTGRIHELSGLSAAHRRRRTRTRVGGMHPGTVVGDATALPFPDDTFDAVATSPAYGNRMADSYDGRDGTTRYTYRCSLGRPSSDGSGAALAWSDAYRQLHRQAIAEMVRVVRPGGRIVVNVRDHIRRGKHVPVVAWWVDELAAATTGTTVSMIDVGAAGIGYVEHPSDLPEMLLVVEVTS